MGFNKKNVEQVSRLINTGSGTRYIYKYTGATNQDNGGTYGGGGADGAKGKDGTNGLNIGLSIPSSVFAARNGTAISGQTETAYIIAYNGASRIDVSVGDVSGQVSGMTTTILNNGEKNAAVKVDISTGMRTTDGSLLIPVWINTADPRDASGNKDASYWDASEYSLTSSTLSYSWKLLDSAADVSIYALDLSNQIAAINCDVDGHVLPTAHMPECTAELTFNGSTIEDASYSIVTRDDLTGVTINASTGELTFTAATLAWTGNSTQIEVNGWVDGEIKASAFMTLLKSMPGGQGADAVSYWLNISANKIKVNPNDNNRVDPSSITATAYKQVGGNTPTTASDCTIYYGYNTTTPSTRYTTAITDISTAKDYICFNLKKGSVVRDSEVVPILWEGRNGEDGEDPYILDLTNENASINCDASGNILAGAVRPSSTARFYIGSERILTGVTYSITGYSTVTTGVSINATTGELTFGNLFNFNALTTEITVKAVWGTIERTIIMTICKSLAGQKGQNGSDGSTPYIRDGYWYINDVSTGVKAEGVDGIDGVDGSDGTSIVWKGSFSSHPSNPEDGWAYYNTTTKKSYTYKSNAWYQMTQDGVDGSNGSDGLSIVWKGDLPEPPSNPQRNWCYRDTDNGVCYIYNGTAWNMMTKDGSDGIDGADGSNGLSVFITYHDNSASDKPATPTGTGTSGGWHTNVTSSVVWLSQKVAESATSGTWGTPLRITAVDGSKGADGLTPYIKDGYWWIGDTSTGVKAEGTDGVDGVDGSDGTSILWQGTYSSHPLNPQEGWAYYNSSTKKSYTYKSGTWYQMTQDGVDGTNGRDGSNGLSIVWKGDLPNPPANPEINWCYRDTDNGICYIWNGTSWTMMTRDGDDGVDGVDGSNGLSVYITYHNNDASNPPSTPTGDGTSGGWHTNVTSSVVWLSQKVSESASTGTWGSPLRIKGTDGRNGIDGSNGITPDIRDGYWWIGDTSTGVKAEGIDGADGVDGSDGVSIVWKGSFASHPLNPEEGWAYYNTQTRKSYTYRSGTWYQMTQDGVDGSNGKDGSNGLSIVWKGESKNPPANPELNWCYRDTDNGICYIWNGLSWVTMTRDGDDGVDGADGSNGLSVFITYNDNDVNTKPSTPTGDGTSGGWHTNVTSSVNWLSQKVAETAASGTWGTPLRITGKDGSNGSNGSTPYIGINGNWWINSVDTGVKAEGQDGNTPYIQDGYWYINGVSTGVKAEGLSVQVQYSINGTTNWHDTFTTGDIYMRERIGNTGTWTTAIRIVGEKGDDGRDGSNGTWVSYVFKQNSYVPNTPTSTLPIPTTEGWGDNPPILKYVKVDTVGDGSWGYNDVTRTWTSNTITHNKTTLEKIHFKTYKDDVSVKISYEIGSEQNYDFGYIGKLDTSLNLNSASTYIVKTSGLTSNSKEIKVPTSGEHYIWAAYKKDSSITVLPDNFKLRFEVPWIWMSKATITDGSAGTWSTPIRMTSDDGLDGLDGISYWLSLSADEVSVDVNNGNACDPSVITIQAWRQVGENNPEQLDASKYVKYGPDASYGYITYTGPINVSQYVPTYHYLAINLFVDGISRDSETVQLLRSGKNGEDGEDGKSPACPYRGNYDPDTVYFGNSKRTDIVKYSGTYYIANVLSGTGTFWGITPTNTTYWSAFGASYSNVATGFLFAEEATIENAVVRKLRTSETGKRVNVENNSISMYDQNNNLRLAVSGESIGSVPISTSYTIPSGSTIQSNRVDDAAVLNIYYTSGNSLSTTISVSSPTNNVTLPSMNVNFSLTAGGTVMEGTAECEWAIWYMIDGQPSGSTTTGTVDIVSGSSSSSTSAYLGGQSTTLTTGTHTIQIHYEFRIYAISGYGTHQDYTIVASTLPQGGTITVNYPIQKCEIGANGFRAMFDGNYYFEAIKDGSYDSNIRFTMQANGYGVQCTNSCLKFKIGGTWYTASREYNNNGYYLKLS